MRLNLLERKALLGLILVISLFITTFTVIGKRNLWFEQKIQYRVVLKNADGLKVGSLVTFLGLRIGEVDRIEINEQNELQVYLSMKKNLANKVTSSTKAMVKRSFLIGEKSIDLVPGEGGEKIPVLGAIAVDQTPEVIDLLTSQKVASVLDRMDGLSKSLNNVSQAIEFTVDRVNPKELGALIQNINSIAKTLAVNPQFTQDMIKALQEAVITLQAMQKSWFLEEHADAIKRKRKRKRRQ